MKKRLLLIGWDSADWKLIHPLLDAGHLPGIAGLVDGGVSGNLATLEPQLSPMLWTSIATGKMAYHHGVKGFTEVDPVSGRVVPVSAATRQCRTLWEILGKRELRSHVVGWFATQGEQGLNGRMVSNMYGHIKGVAADADPANWPPPMPGTYWPPELAAELDDRRILPADINGEILRLFVPEAPRIDQQRDRRLQNLAEKLAEAYSVQAAACHLMQSDPEWDFMAVYFRAIDEICHRLWGQSPQSHKIIDVRWCEAQGAPMARSLRFEYPGAIYHVMARGDGGKTVFENKDDCEVFLHRLGEACGSCGWRVHAWVLMGNHFHLLLETPQANLVAGMKWLLGVFSQGWNRVRGRKGKLIV